ncbi:uvrD-like helicase C-terminal domain protein [Lyngbya aestuarii BL J]|mgnify:CR=1 FL=1|uniref:UvrD-like helicase C-terminal domain protein n=1 Tax=Lyngbya aestuarii BL J TaxID=1348334 RepID=U7QNL7_9CYAN|nr:3'-5' exonuclease [Lyngbya aestuarii]ERT08720.1 uvrD-like helicase C-terminal domain protein [Lyngbya aestuarii BL J]
MVFRTKEFLEQYEAALKNLNFPVKQIHRDQPDNPSEPGIRMGTMHRVKGLQFDYVFIPGLNSDSLPLQNGLNDCADSASQERLINGERCLLHVASTRAKKQVIVTYYGQPSSLLVGEAYKQ